MIVFLDTNILGLVASPSKTDKAKACNQWFYSLLARSVYVISSELYDYETRRSLILASFIDSQVQGIDNLNFLHSLIDFFPVTQDVFNQAAQLWAESRQKGQPTADSKNIDADVIIAATCQIIQAESPGQNLVVATTNVKHLSRFITANTWQEITF